MDKPTIKIVVTGGEYDLEMRETEPGKIAISLFRPDDEQAGAYAEFPTKVFLEALRKAVPEHF